VRGRNITRFVRRTHCNFVSKRNCLLDQYGSTKSVSIAFDNWHHLAGGIGSRTHVVKPCPALNGEFQSHCS
jgi:hypothetical protein